MPVFRSTIAMTLLAASTAGAQAYNYPALQTPRIVEREYNFAAASGSRSGTSLIFQWREGMSEQLQFGVDGGLAAPEGGGNTRLIVGGSFAWQAARTTADFPFDVALTAGMGASIGGGSVLRIPFGAVVGHTFDLEDNFRLTPYVHPRLSIDRCSNCGGGGNSDSKLNVDVDVGVDFVATPQVSLRLAALLGGSNYTGSNAIGFSVAWTPKGLKK